MPPLIRRPKELLRISPKDATLIEYSLNDGRTWNRRYKSNNTVGQFMDLMDNGEIILATASKGMFISRNEGRTWNRR
ncbi:MAG: hypothetical protein EAS48_09850 [Chryseobacterium sp.]|nr:MAG: hypothetical protein EAS48_09850 [Chryseobacterium sp.]